MNKTRLMLILAFMAVFAAGGAATMLARQVPSDDRRSAMARRLDLTETQSRQLRDIWDKARAQARQGWPQHRTELRQQRDEQIRELLSPEVLAKYQAIEQQHQQRLDALRDQQREVFAEARRRTRTILDDQQWNQWDELTGRRFGRHGARNEKR